MNKKHKPTAGLMECRSYQCEVRAEQDEQNGTYITGHPIVFGQVTELKTWAGTIREVIDPKAIDAQTDMKDVRFLVGHDDTRIPMARSRNNNKNSTMQLTPDTIGLGMRANIDTENNGTARELYSAAGRGDISGMSFRFSAFSSVSSLQLFSFLTLSKTASNFSLEISMTTSENIMMNLL